MTLTVLSTKQFERDLKRQKKRGKDIRKFASIARTLVAGGKLPFACRNHKLSGKYRDHWECHIEPDWLLIYLRSNFELVWVRTGSHSDLFD